MPIGITYNAGDLILQSVSSSGNTFQENKIAAATSSLILFNSSGNLTSQSLNVTTVGTSSYLSGSNIIVSSITASNISASGNISASTFVGTLTGSLFGTSSWSTNSLTASSLISGNSYNITNLTASNISASGTGSFGRVGIGTTSPVALLSVVPSGSAFDNTNAMAAYFGKNTSSSYGSTFIRVAISHNATTTGSSANYTDIEQNSGGSGPFRYGTYVDTNIINSNASTSGVYGSINFVTSGSARMTIAGGTSAGNVGIGTTNPDTSLSIKRNSSGYVFRAASNVPTAALMGSFERQNGSGSVTGATRFGFTSNISEIQSLTGFAFFINGTSDLNSQANGTQSLTILSTSGNVGIGTTSPAYLLDVSGSSRFGFTSTNTHQFTGSVSISGSLNATSSWSTNALTASYVTSSNIVGTVTSASYALSASSAPTTITASWATNALTASSLVSANSYTITNLTASNISASETGSFGMVGIGTTTPKAKLQVSGSILPVGHLTAGQDLGSQLNYWNTLYSNTANFYQNVTIDAGDFIVGTSDFVVRNVSGNVGIGTTNPAYLLDVSGSSRFGFTSTNTHQFTGSVSISGSLNATSSWATNALTSSYVTSSNVVGTVASASYALSASFAPTTITASWATNALTASSLVVGNSYNITNLTASNIGVSNAIINGNLTVTGSIFASLFSASNIYITSSTLTVTDNIITINALNPYQRYAGLEMYDSGSGTLSNFLWDSLNNYFFISSSDAGASRRVILGPIGEASLTQNYIPLISGSNNITSSVIYQSSGLIGIGTSAPVALLTVGSTGTTSSEMTLLGEYQSSSFNNSNTFNFRHGGSDRWRLVTNQNTAASNDFDFRINAINAAANGYNTFFVIKGLSGNVGIGTSSPAYLLDVSGSSRFGFTSTNTHQFTGSVSINGSLNATSSWSTNSLTASSLVVGNSYNITNLTASNISASGTLTVVGASTFGTVTATAITGALSGSSIATGNANIVGGTINGTTIGATTSAAGTFGVLTAVSGALNGITIGLTSPLAGKFTTITASNISASGNITATSFSGSHFGTSSWATNSLTASSLVVGNSYNITNLTASNISASGTGSFNMVGVGTSSPGAILEVSSSTALTIFNVKGAGGANLFTVSGSGNIGVGTTPSTSYKMQINGSFSATTKSFDIDHPVKSGKRLVYGSLESPYHGVRLTGKGKLVKGKGVIQLPDYMNALVDYDNPNVQITNIKHNKVIYVDGIDEKNNIINIAAKIPKTQLNKELEFYWTFTAVRKDVPPLQVEC